MSRWAGHPPFMGHNIDNISTRLDTVTSLMWKLLEFAGANGNRETATERQPTDVSNAKKTKGLVDANLLTL
jgi:hypothetical protein